MTPGTKSSEFVVTLAVLALCGGAMWKGADAGTVTLAAAGIGGAYVGGRSFVKGSGSGPFDLAGWLRQAYPTREVSPKSGATASATAKPTAKK